MLHLFLRWFLQVLKQLNIHKQIIHKHPITTPEPYQHHTNIIAQSYHNRSDINPNSINIIFNCQHHTTTIPRSYPNHPIPRSDLLIIGTVGTVRLVRYGWYGTVGTVRLVLSVRQVLGKFPAICFEYLAHVRRAVAKGLVGRPSACSTSSERACRQPADKSFCEARPLRRHGGHARDAQKKIVVNLPRTCRTDQPTSRAINDLWFILHEI